MLRLGLPHADYCPAVEKEAGLEHSQGIDALSCSGEIRDALVSFAGGLEEILGGDLVAIYICGSLARGCFKAKTSDVDLLVVLGQACDTQTAERILKRAQEEDIAIDATFVTDRDVNRDVFPAPVEFLLKDFEGPRVVRPPGGSVELALQRQDVLEAGVALIGPAACELIQPVAWPLIEESLEYVFGHVAERFKDPVLVFCRIAYTYSSEKICSKKAAGQWALEEFGPQQAALIKRALEAYSGCEADPAIETDQVRAFEEYCADYITALGK